MLKLSSGPISQRVSHGVKEFGDASKVSGLNTGGLRDPKKSTRAAPADGVINNSNYSNLPMNNYKQNGDHQSGSLQLGRDGKGLGTFGIGANKPQYIPRRAGGISAAESGRLRDREGRSNYE